MFQNPEPTTSNAGTEEPDDDRCSTCGEVIDPSGLVLTLCESVGTTGEAVGPTLYCSYACLIEYASE